MYISVTLPFRQIKLTDFPTIILVYRVSIQGVRVEHFDVFQVLFIKKVDSLIHKSLQVLKDKIFMVLNH